MLKRLHITNFALIQEMDVNFPGELTVITGETGAGKSIFLEALALALGNRADAAVLQSKTQKCVIEAEFEVFKNTLHDFFKEYDIDEDDTIILRREIYAEGKSRSFLNDTPVTQAALKNLSAYLIDIHSQHQTLLLNKSNFQLEIIDAFAATLQDFKSYKTEFNKLQKLKSELIDLQHQETAAKKELDYFEFLFNELQEAKIEVGSLKKLEEESKLLENAEQIKGTLQSAYTLINSGDENMLSSLGQIKQQLNGLTKFGESYKTIFDRLSSALIELKDISNELENLDEAILFDTNRLEIINEALDKLNRLLKKHSVNSEEELLQIKNDIETKLTQFSSLETKIEKLKTRIAAQQSNCVKLATALDTNRKGAIALIEKNIKEKLFLLAMPNANFKIEIKTNNELTVNGFNEVEFLFSANKGMALNDISKVASGGELSRLMLSLKALLASKKQLPTIVFDEIDTGVSGEVADKIGTILNEMGATMQVIAITHLPQLASKGKHHLFVYKKDGKEKTNSFIKDLTEAERVEEIAKMLSTGKPSATALSNAKELLNA